ncbi:AAA family ATPase [Chitinophaga sp. CF418]|uniref:AAA family ATPase n=1 Tax=Chitinophaga sp. CF418 TaxID=1855287 RepID=UPI0009174E46|nr:AAA family ATPase [Chitinophaga sp. CF418]SHN32589.1 Predicted ATPase [Chitinophaga sp. CF418]
MSRIRIKNFGPIKEGLLDNNGWIEVKKATVFIGNQGSGKSAVAKLISTFTWIEKALVRGDYDKKWFERKNKLQNQYLKYHRLENYLQVKGDNKTEIEYRGDAYWIKYVDGSLSINETSGSSYSLPQIMYVPAERNFIAYVKTAKELKLSSESLKEFLTEFENAKDAMKGHVKLPINNSDIEYDKLNDTLNLRGDGYKTKLTDASSGFQSLVPLFLVSDFLAVSVKKQSDKEPMSSDELQRFKKGIVDIWANTSLTDEQRRIALSALSSKFNKTAFVNIVEEPEQNLFPSSQWQALQCLLEFNNMSDGNKLIITTHSPYIINFLSIAIQADYLRDKIIEAKKQNEFLPRLEKVVSGKSLISSASVIVYQLNEVDGTIKTLSAPEGIPTDKNYLNDMLREGNNLFDTLLEIEEEI